MGTILYPGGAAFRVWASDLKAENPKYPNLGWRATLEYLTPSDTTRTIAPENRERSPCGRSWVNTWT